MLTSASTLTLDVIAPLARKGMDEKKKLVTMRVFIMFFIVVSAAIAIVKNYTNFSFIAQMMGVSWGALAGAFLAPFLYGLYMKRTTKAACAVNFIFSTVVMLANVLVRDAFPAILKSPINAGAFCMLAGFIIVPLVSAFTKAPDEERVDSIFSCYDRKIMVTVKESIGAEEENA